MLRSPQLSLGALAVLLALWIAPSAEAQRVEQTEAARQAIQKALEYLKSTQRANGAWRGDVGYKLNNGYQVTARAADHVGITSLAGMAFLAAGNLPGRGPFGEQVAGALRYILSCVNDQGFISDNGSRMYSQAFATLFLAEIYGTTRSRKVHDSLKRAVRYIVDAQNLSGGWRYAPKAKDSDMSIVVCQVQALRAARNVGISVPISVIRKAQAYVKRSARANGGFYYQVDTSYPSRDSFALAAAGVTALQGTALYDDHRVRAGLEYIKLTRRHNRHYYKNSYFYFYGHYYAVQAMYLAGLKWPRYWQDWYPSVRDELVASQDRRTGAWINSNGPGNNMSTAMGALILQIPYRYLPIFQR